MREQVRKKGRGGCAKLCLIHNRESLHRICPWKKLFLKQNKDTCEQSRKKKCYSHPDEMTRKQIYMKEDQIIRI